MELAGDNSTWPANKAAAILSIPHGRQLSSSLGWSENEKNSGKGPSSWGVGRR